MLTAPEDQAVFRALADPTRRRLLDELRGGPRTTGDLVAAHTEMTRYGVMAHLDVLEEAGLVIVSRSGRRRLNHLNPVPIVEIHQRWLSPYTEAAATELLSLKRVIETEQRRTGMDDPRRAAVAVEFEAQVAVAADVSAVWRALTDEIGNWWSHSFTDHPYAIVLEPRIGGRFYEQFDESGAGALYATVTYLEPHRILRISGPMGMPGARQYVKTYRLEAADGGTVVRTTASILGDLDPDMLERYRTGGESLLARLKEYAERRPR